MSAFSVLYRKIKLLINTERVYDLPDQQAIAEVPNYALPRFGLEQSTICVNQVFKDCRYLGWYIALRSVCNAKTAFELLETYYLYFIGEFQIPLTDQTYADFKKRARSKKIGNEQRQN